MRKKSILVLGDYRQTVTVVRSLGRAGFDVVLGCERPQSSTALSRHVTGVRLFDGLHPQRFCYQLEACLRKDRPDFVFPVGESQLRRALRHDPDRLLSLATWVIPEPATVLRCFDKRAMYQLATGLGIPTAPWRPFTNAENLLLDAAELGYPVVLKRRDSSGRVRKKKALICRGLDDLEQFLLELRYDSDAASLVLQKYAPGVRHNCHIAAVRGRMVAFFQQKVLRTDEADGTGVGIEGISVEPSPQLRAYCERLLVSLGYTGIGCIQFLLDDVNDSIAFLGFNARMDSTAALPYRLGVDFPLMAVRIAAGEPVNGPADYALGKRYYWLYGDLRARLAQDAEKSPRQMLGAFWKMPLLLARSYELVFEWRDPLPALHEFWRKAVDSLLKPRRAAGNQPIERAHL